MRQYIVLRYFLLSNTGYPLWILLPFIGEALVPFASWSFLTNIDDLLYSQSIRIFRFIRSFGRSPRGAAPTVRRIRPAQSSGRKNICLASGACVVTASVTYLAIFPVKQKWLFSVLVLFNWTFINVRATVRAVITETISRYNVSGVRVLSAFDGSAKRGRAGIPSRVTRALRRTRRRRASAGPT